ncbi:AsmA family protein [Rhodospirillum rubrum]|uniref:AsmA n=1 Tax=Rhodospirillum rubrum (strain ATCC 11170 / ATH 1.1.1 / DSM 467 / LMG 4362 / NCIMB 8255 / S1) TaxID=269796 RepID=Q2RS86_RHORT|nr:AsmA family protein [Rhodospirillum rubrum]ABC23009.1 AsmA [Rhodospirillum rubrum ATCC 11170]AEO48738.1 AsmA [Rhodospirillum rubrum F11]MBK5954632.1 cell envelope biogenesis protein AsmA [Rhodospirillum rubrum]QXG78993.1 AsmA family protein [Rhodospirillum rubrum]HAQ00175.1 cell envelope biogenesis protein AsmA [Rhodospirillum rubrum]
MRTLLFGTVVLIALMVGTVLAVPSFVDWNLYRDRLSAEIQRITGRALVVEGDLSLHLLPTPALAAQGVSLANAPGGSDPVMARVDSVQVKVDLLPLLHGEVVVRSVEIIRPVIVLERLADGRGNWEMRAGQGGGDEVDGRLPGAPPVESADPLEVAFNHVEIVDGVVRYRDGGTERVIDNLDVTLVADRLNGPFSLQGRATALGLPVSLQAMIGAIDAGRATQVGIKLGLENQPSVFELTGLVSGLSTGPTLRGSMGLAVDDPAAALDRLGAAMGRDLGLSAGPMKLPLRVNSRIELSSAAAKFDDMVVQLAGNEVKGGASAVFGAVPRIDAAFVASRIDLEAWKTAWSDQPGGSPAALAVAHAEEKPPAWRFPQDLAVTLDLAVDAAIYNGSALRDLRLSAALSKGEVTINQLSARLPGVSDVSAFGFLTTPTEGLAIDLTLAGRSDNLRALLDWLKVDVGGVPGDRLRRFDGQATVVGTAAQVKITGLDVSLDTSQIRGAFTLRPGKRPGIGATVMVDRLDLDAYRSEAAQATGDPLPLLAGFERLNAFDTSFDFKAGAVTLGGESYGGIAVKGSLVKGKLTLAEATVADGPGGMRLGLGGAVSGFGGAPGFDNLTYDIEIPDPARVVRALRLDLPLAIESIDKLVLTGTVNGTANALTLRTTTTGDGATLNTEGTLVGAFAGVPTLSMGIGFAHPDAASFLAMVFPGYRAQGLPGALRLQGQLAGDLSTMALSDIQATVGAVPLSGSIAVNRKGDRPFVEADLQAGDLDLDPLLPASRLSALERPRAVRAAGLMLGGGSVAPPSLLPLRRVATSEGAVASPPDKEALADVDGALALRATSLTYAGLRLEQASLRAKLVDGVVTLSPVEGTLYGGRLKATAQRTPGPMAAYTLGLTLDGFKAGDYLAARGMAGGSGSGSLVLDLAARGEEDLVSTLSGKGVLSLTAIDVSDPSAPGRGLARLAGLLGGLGDLAGPKGAVGGPTPGAALDLNGPFSLEKGVVSFEAISLRAADFSASLSGRLDLGRDSIDAQGRVALSPEARAALAKDIALPDDIPFGIRGPLAKPVVRVLTPPLR